MVSAKAGITADQVTSLEFVSGKVTAGDLEYIQKNVNQIQEFKCNLKNGLTYEDKKGRSQSYFRDGCSQKSQSDYS